MRTLMTIPAIIGERENSVTKKKKKKKVLSRGWVKVLSRGWVRDATGYGCAESASSE